MTHPFRKVGVIDLEIISTSSRRWGMVPTGSPTPSLLPDRELGKSMDWRISLIFIQTSIMSQASIAFFNLEPNLAGAEFGVQIDDSERRS